LMKESNWYKYYILSLKKDVDQAPGILHPSYGPTQKLNLIERTRASKCRTHVLK
jgi:hypothetical protein